LSPSSVFLFKKALLRESLEVRTKFRLPNIICLKQPYIRVLNKPQLVSTSCYIRIRTSIYLNECLRVSQFTIGTTIEGGSFIICVYQM
jgi:hypothetical protein